MIERALPLEGAVNLRDFGGYLTEDGNRVRTGRLFRSGSLARLSETAQQAFAGFGIGLICDLRRDNEKAAAPTPFPSDAPRRLELPIEPGSARRLYREMGRTALTLEQSIDFMVNINRELARHHADDYARMFEGLLELGDGGFLVHCSAGKDRTGFACALILHALGVPQATVLEDYLLTNEALDIEGYILPVLTAKYGVPDDMPAEAMLAIAGVRPEYLQAAFDTIEAEFEGVEHYLERAVGLDRAARETLRRRYVESV
ncbi:tyrosine-protein phosphatase [Elongatibacter sediminis]|uniref:Tyrosine-protein phosphatase n=1 Tax=Elongatibacter sediminis TaxID=3119006 RepID=A0AAW9RIA1_9GAMM